jgi:hypothetical protein
MEVKHGPFTAPPNLDQLSREQLIDAIHRLVASLNQLRDLVLKLTAQRQGDSCPCANPSGSEGER